MHHPHPLREGNQWTMIQGNQLSAIPRTVTVILIILIAVAGLQALALAWMFKELSAIAIQNRITVGMTTSDVESRLGKPFRHWRRGDSSDPKWMSRPHPGRQDYDLAYVYVWRLVSYVHVLFDGQGNVITYYVGYL